MRRIACLAVTVGALATVACKPKAEPEPPMVEVKKPAAPPEEMPDSEWEQWKAEIAERERQKSNQPPPKIEINWPAGIDTELADFNGWWIRLKAPVTFAADNRSVTGKGKEVLDELTFIMNETPRITRIEVQSHRHGRTEAVEGENITQLRANTVKAYLVGKGVEAGRIDAKGYEDTMPIDTNTTEAGRRANSRIEVIVRMIDDKQINTDQ